MKETNDPAVLFGEIRKIKIESPGEVNEEAWSRIKSPLEREGSVAKLFCLGCASVYELSGDRAEELAKISRVELPEQGDYFFQAQGCSACDGDAGKVTLQRIDN